MKVRPAFPLAAAVVCLAFRTEFAVAQDLSTVRNARFGFQISYPSSWKAIKTKQADTVPKAEDFRSGKATLDFSMPNGDTDDWNAVSFSGKGVPPATMIYCIEKPAESFDAFSNNLQRLLRAMMNDKVQIIEAKPDIRLAGIPGYEFLYRTEFGSKNNITKLIVLFEEGKQYRLSFWASEDKFTAEEQVFNSLIRSFRASK